MNKNPRKKIDGRNNHRGDKKGRPKKGQKTNSPQEQKKKKERASQEERQKKISGIPGS
jgi:hypothetical protein